MRFFLPCRAQAIPEGSGRRPLGADVTALVLLLASVLLVGPGASNAAPGEQATIRAFLAQLAQQP